MSKYHERITAIAAKHDWTTVEGIATGLRDLELEGYGTEFQIYRDGLPVDEEAARQAIIDEVTAPSLVEKDQRILQKMTLEGSVNSWTIYVEADPAGGLAFEHGDFRQPLILGEFEIVTGAKKVEQRHNRRTKKQIKKEDRAQKLQEKLDDTQNTDETHYLVHANQCGYLVRNTAMRFYNTGRGQWGISMMTRINGIVLSKLQEFIDSTGNPTLSGVSTHVDTSLETDVAGEDSEGGVLAMHSDFAKEIVDFLNLEFEMDIDGIKSQYRESDSRFQPIEHWGGGRAAVLEKLLERRKDLDPADITEAFEMGYGSELLD